MMLIQNPHGQLNEHRKSTAEWLGALSGELCVAQLKETYPASSKVLCLSQHIASVQETYEESTECDVRSAKRK